MPKFDPHYLRTRSRETQNTVSGAAAGVVVQNGIIIPDDMVLYVWRVKGVNTWAGGTRLVAYAGDAANPIRRIVAEFVLDAVAPIDTPPSPYPEQPLFIVKPNTGVVPTQENIISFGDNVGGGGNVAGITMSYYMVRKG